MQENTVMSVNDDNPFFQVSSLDFNFPQFDLIKVAHYGPAFERGMAEQSAEVAAIANQLAAPTFENTLVAMELTGQLLHRVSAVFYSMAGAHTNDDIQSIAQQLAPLLADHDDSIVLNQALFARISQVYEARHESELDAESLRLVEQYYVDFVRSGAKLSSAEQQIMRETNAELASLSTQFSQNVLNEVNDLAIVVVSREQLSGLSEVDIDAAAKQAEARDLPGQYVLPLLNTSGQPVLANLQNRELRQRIHNTSLSRGSRGGDFDNRETMSRILTLRAQRAQLLGYSNHAEYVLEDATAQTVSAVNQRLAELTPPAVANTLREAADLQQMIDEEGGDFELAAWDWAYYSEKLRQARYQYDDSQLSPYLELNNVLTKGVFYAAQQLYGISFIERFDLPVYQADVRVFEVRDITGTTLAYFLADYYARPSKRGGAWMNAYRSQNELLDTQPVVANHLNITKPAPGQPTLLSFSEVTTLFHEFGHALHGMFSSVQYPYFSGTAVPRDFVEYPSQVNEMWAAWPQVLENYAVHYQTGEAMPAELLEKVLAAQKFNQGFATTEYLSASLLDQAFHQLDVQQIPSADEILEFEAAALASAGVALPAVPPRYRSNYFSHIMGGYSAGYYSYIWSEVLDADTVQWFKENGGLLRSNGDHFRQTLLSRGGSEEAMSLFRNFRGRDADVQALLIRRGLL
ncbi:MAG: dipeptidyl carboxypeptidase II [SAR86 cluster bacterium]|uniref:Dipeptidyl carboxypeptidase n=1 Tax=SAR86 cluster bacterium TaxID=2030880 RepID=A0A2A4MQ77_9GAMM|nr:MAG: dipeptidyl carboxypeptidase II [SAR86 cluster bacterium]